MVGQGEESPGLKKYTGGGSNIYGVAPFDWTTILQKIFYLHCVCIFSLSYLGGGGGGGGGGGDVSNFLSVFPYSLFLKLCALV